MSSWSLDQYSTISTTLTLIWTLVHLNYLDFIVCELVEVKISLVFRPCRQEI